jgi:uncharacterized protein YbaR (Trm112 family)
MIGHRICADAFRYFAMGWRELPAAKPDRAKPIYTVEDGYALAPPAARPETTRWMTDQYDDDQDTDTLTVAEEPKSSARILSAIKKASRDLYDWQALCDRIDDIYGRKVGYIETEWSDVDYDLFWASMEIMKPAIYARPPRPVVSPMFKDRRQLQNVTAELLERNVTSTFSMVGAGIDEAMICARDDLIFYNRGQLWLTYETDEDGGGQRVCTEHLDRKDFLIPQVRKWSDLPWASRRAWMTRKEMRKRFRKTSGDAYMGATVCTGEGENKENEGKYGVWEVWHKGDKRVYWVAEGVPVMLDEGKPHLTLRGFFPCPRPAFGTLRPRTSGSCARLCALCRSFQEDQQSDTAHLRSSRHDPHEGVDPRLAVISAMLSSKH